MLRIFPNSAPNGVNESLVFAQALAKQGLKSLLANRDITLVLYLMLVLLPAEQGGVFQKNSCKQNSVWAHDTSDGKVIFALLEKIVILQVNFTLINVWEPSFHRPLTWAFIVGGGGNNRGRNKCRRSRIQNGPKDPPEVIFQISNHGRVGGARSNNQNNDRCNSMSKSMYRGGSRIATIATLGGDSAASSSLPS